MRAITDGLVAALRKPLLVAILFAGSAALLILFYLWLSISESSTGVLAASLIVLVAGLAGAMWLFAMSLAAFHAEGGRSYLIVALRRLPKFIPWALVFGGAIYGMSWVAGKSRVPFWLLASVAILLLLPIASQAAGGSFSLGSALRVLARGPYWIAGILAVVLGVVLPKVLVMWIPNVSGLTAQSTSVGVRFGLALLLAVLSWLMLAAVIGTLGSNIGRETRS